MGSGKKEGKGWLETGCVEGGRNRKEEVLSSEVGGRPCFVLCVPAAIHQSN